MLLTVLCFVADPMGSFAEGGHITTTSGVVALGCIGAALAALRPCASPLLEIREGRWRVINPIKEWSFDQDAIVVVDESRLGYPGVALADGQRILVGALDESNLSGFLGLSPMTDRLAAKASSAMSDAAAGAECRWSRPYWGEWVVPVAGLVYIVLVLIRGSWVKP